MPAWGASAFSISPLCPFWQDQGGNLVFGHARRPCILLGAAFLLPIVGQGTPRVVAQASASATAAQVVTVTANDSRYTPSKFHVKKGAHVDLRITAEDRQHGFRINLHPDGGGQQGKEGLVFTDPRTCWKIPKGQTVSIQFTAAEEGSYAFQCCNFCGLGHFGMKGQVIVDP
jgi:heme/copper-type cytochrome/quinol oxidase subunit 2